MSNIRVNSITDRLGTGSPDFPNGITIDTVTVSGKIVHTGDTDTSIGFPINDTITMDTAGTERMRIDSSGKVLIGTATSVSNNMLVIAQASGDGVNSGFLMQRNGAAGTSFKIDIDSSDVANFRRGVTNAMSIDSSGNVGIGNINPTARLEVVTSSGTATAKIWSATNTTPIADLELQRGTNATWGADNYGDYRLRNDTGALLFQYGESSTTTERARIDSNGYLLVGKTAPNGTDLGFFAGPDGLTAAVVGTGAGYALFANRQNDDGVLVSLRQGNVSEGSISVSGTTVSYNGGHLSRWAQFPDNSRPELLKGTVMSNLDQMSNWDNEENEQLNCVQVSTVEGDANVAGVFVAWDSTDDGYNDILLAMTGDMVIRIGAGVTVSRGDLLMSAGDGTAKPQEDDIVRSKTIAKVTSTHISHIYEDGSYCVPCVIMAC